MSHLGERVSGLVDGQLSPADTERAMAHLAGCRPCRDAVETERLMKARLACLAGPGPSGDLVGRLLAMGGPSGPMPPRPGYVPGSPRPQPVSLSRPVPVPGRPVTAARLAVRPAAGRVALRTGRAAGRAVGAVRAATVARPVPARPVGSRPAGRPTGLAVPRARLAGAVLGALGVVGAGVGGLVLAAPGASVGAGTAGLTIQQASRTASPGAGVGFGRRSSTAPPRAAAPGSVSVGLPAGASVLAVDLTGLPSTPAAHPSGR